MLYVYIYTYNILNHVGTADFHDGGKAFNCLYCHMNNASLCARACLSSSMPISFSIGLFHSVDVAYWFNYNYMLANLLR